MALDVLKGHNCLGLMGINFPSLPRNGNLKNFHIVQCFLFTVHGVLLQACGLVRLLGSCLSRWGYDKSICQVLSLVSLLFWEVATCLSGKHFKRKLLFFHCRKFHLITFPSVFAAYYLQNSSQSTVMEKFSKAGKCCFYDSFDSF